ncbi:hypothetical protein BU26DRAFT_525086 [Trematosphaeria pertusa]|uniref:Secreted protein n=1 Tax=Trematosphaeria pertusa TaxID=390896 RepID=A0A6A6HU77_9PLEO|nr:uncharacterized protein BU26DRAFT_525086 [Trematosphaeria pertusa]KAF2241587.1 hypothetical protein BU26DRAFT_525086 [Trematosphaeria pertusa]
MEELCISCQGSMGWFLLLRALFRPAFSTGGGCMFLLGVHGTGKDDFWIGDSRGETKAAHDFPLVTTVASYMGNERSSTR